MARFSTDDNQKLMKLFMSENNPMLAQTGFILMKDEKTMLWYYHTKFHLLIPKDQAYISQVYEDAFLLKKNTVWLGGYKLVYRCPYYYEAKEIFKGLEKISELRGWNIGLRIWAISETESLYSGAVYDGRLGNTRNKNYMDSVSYLQCLRLPDFNNIQGQREAWERLDSLSAKYGLVPVQLSRTEAEKMVMQTEKEKRSAKVEHAVEEELTKEKENTDLVKRLLNCDKDRCKLEEYEESLLYDIKRGHWDLLGSDKADSLDKGKKLVARDPRKDIKRGIVGIDFGTKSTVVVRQNDSNNIIPIRIGTGGLSAEIKETDYENPTIIECSDLDKFVEDYFEKQGRPNTSCEDFFVSYDAFRDYSNCPPHEFYAYYGELKQWANDEKRDISVLDKQFHEYGFGQDSLKEDKVINPIELYAYYIGMYINNMRNGIYLNYIMSFPVGYSKETRQFIVDSFEKGIRKSLPDAVLNDENCMKEFKVRLGISEPAAYAVTALEQSGLDPQNEDEKYTYGIFDFGGGTTDFDFGVWRGASEDEYEIEGYDYVLECFGADSDVTLGGENILELLSYEVFKNNKELARKKRITCTLPVGEEAFLGSEVLISDSQIAKRNMTMLKEELRPLWHQDENWREKYRHEPEEEKSGGDKNFEEYIELTMYDINGKPEPNCRFRINTDQLIQLIKKRIQKGVRAFFKCMEKTFKTQDEDKKVYIFLAGNASKSVFVKQLFEDTIEEYYEKFKDLDSTAGDDYFKLMEPLNGQSKKDHEYVPNAKTGVAYGLIKSRDGSSIKIVKNYETDAVEETRFKYYLGRERRHKFECRLSPAEVRYNSWIKFQGAVKEIVRIYYTTNPMADSRAEPLPIDGILYKEIKISPKEGEFLFIRTCEPAVMEYVIAKSEEEIEEKGEIQKFDFRM